MRPTDADTWFAALFDAHRADLLRYALRRVPADAATDVVAETFLVAWRRRSDVPPEHVREWLFRVAANVIANDLRGRGRAERVVSRLAVAPVPDADFEVALTTGDAVRRALLTLLPAEAEALRLTTWDGLTPAEAARVVGCSPATFRVRLHRARRRFAAAYESIGGRDED